jgi:prepilin-type N-terminal cleavage/methylation domain-containing protein
MSFIIKNKRKPKGFTLVEVMVATFLFALSATGFLLTILQAYRLAAETRIRNEVRYVLKSMADQFTRLPYESTNPLFTINATPTGTGLYWRRDINAFSLKPGSGTNVNYIYPSASGLTVPLARNGNNTTEVTFTCWVRAVNPTTGVASTTPTVTAGGYILRGDFEATFNVSGQPKRQSLTTLRTIR